MLKHVELLRILEDHIEQYGSLRKTATAFGVSPQYLSSVLSGYRSAGPKILRPLKLKRKVTKVVTYEEVKQRASR